jgi:hypothetical protein
MWRAFMGLPAMEVKCVRRRRTTEHAYSRSYNYGLAYYLHALHLASALLRSLSSPPFLVATLILRLRQVSGVPDVASCLKGWVELD